MIQSVILVGQVIEDLFLFWGMIHLFFFKSYFDNDS